MHAAGHENRPYLPTFRQVRGGLVEQWTSAGGRKTVGQATMPGMARSRTRLDPGLAKRLAAGVVRDQVEAVADAVAREAKDRAPDAKQWVTDGGEHVRPSHAEVKGTMVPENIPYQLTAMTYVRKGRTSNGNAANAGGGWKATEGVDLADRPRDPQLPLYQSVNCHCRSVAVPGVIAAATRAVATRVQGTRVTAGVETVFPRIGEAEFGTNGATGVHFLAVAASVVMARRR